VVATQRQVQAVHAVVHQLDGKARLAQALPQIVARLGLVFDDQDFHVPLQRASVPVCARP